jgi:hypothetical protein
MARKHHDEPDYEPDVRSENERIADTPAVPDKPYTPDADPQVEKLKYDTPPPTDVPIERPVGDMADESSREIEKVGVATWVEQHDERPPDQRPKQVEGVAQVKKPAA